MKPLFATVLALLMLVQSFNRTALVVDYALNRIQITAEYCVNKAKPALHCNGKCHLAKQLKKADQAEQKLPSSIKGKVEVLQYCAALPTFSFFFPSISEPVYPVFRTQKCSPPNFGIFHPPRFLA